MNLEDSIKFAHSYLKKKNLSFDLIATESFSFSLEIFNKKISNIENENTRGLGVRVFKNNKPGYSYTEKLDELSIQTILENAISLCEINSPLEIDLAQNITSSINLKTFNFKIEEDISWEKMHNATLEMEKNAYEENSLIQNVPYSYMGKSKSETFFINSNDLFFEKINNSFSLGIGTVAKKNHISKMGSYFRSGRNLDRIEPVLISKEAVRRALSLIDAKPIKSGKYAVLLSNLISSSLFASFSSIFYAESVQKSQSKLKNKLKEKIASSILNLNCEPHKEDLPGCRVFDGEGILTKKTPVIKNGILETFLYNLETAKKDNVLSTGHAKKFYSGEVGTSFSNFIIQKGDKTLQELLNTFNTCFYITKLGFNSSSCDSISGMISIEAQGFLYKDGKYSQAVDSVVLNTNFFDLLQKIVAISNSYSDSFSNYKVPDILIEDINIAGN